MNTKQTEALKLALEALEVATTPLAKDRQKVLRARAAIREALAERCVCGEPDTRGTHRTDGPCLAEQPAPVAEPHKQQEPATGPDCWVCVKDGKIIGFYDRPFTLAGIEAVRYVHHEEVESLAIENIRLQNWARDLNDWNDSLKERLSYREAYPANFTRDWEGLTDAEARELSQGNAGYAWAAREAERLLKEKNA